MVDELDNRVLSTKNVERYYIVIVLLPMAVMMLGELCKIRISKFSQAASQYLSAGMILGAVSCEIQPMIKAITLDHQSLILCLAALLFGGGISLGLNAIISNVDQCMSSHIISEWKATFFKDIDDMTNKFIDSSDNECDKKGFASAYGTSSCAAVDKQTQMNKYASSELIIDEDLDDDNNDNDNEHVIDVGLVNELLASIKTLISKLNQHGASLDRASLDETVHALEEFDKQGKQYLRKHIEMVNKAVYALDTVARDITAKAMEESGVKIGLGSCVTAKSPIPYQKFAEAMMHRISDVEFSVERLHGYVERTHLTGPTHEHQVMSLLLGGHWALLRRNMDDTSQLVDSTLFQQRLKKQHKDASFVVKTRSVLILTVSVDAFMDGLLIGLCTVSNPTTSVVMALATRSSFSSYIFYCVDNIAVDSLEMGFLGLAYGSVVRGDLFELARFIEDLKEKQMPIGHLNHYQYCLRFSLLIPPIMMFFGGLIGTTTGLVLQENELLFLVTLSFGSTSLVFLVTEELLIEARKNNEGNKSPNIITSMLFVGIFLSFVLSTSHVGNV